MRGEDEDGGRDGRAGCVCVGGGKATPPHSFKVFPDVTISQSASDRISMKLSDSCTNERARFRTAPGRLRQIENNPDLGGSLGLVGSLVCVCVCVCIHIYM